jgi:xanthine dehydrogenase molybdopterin-binding subunit B
MPQIEGGFVQGMGWLCLEEMIWGDKVGAGRPGVLADATTCHNTDARIVVAARGDIAICCSHLQF